MNELSHPGSRVAGVLLAAVIVFFLDTRSASILHQLFLPLGLAFAAWLMTRSLMAVAFATFTLAAINSQLNHNHWIPSLAYPMLAAAGLITCIVIGRQRFKQRVTETHEARWTQRRERVERSEWVERSERAERSEQEKESETSRKDGDDDQ